MFVFDTNMCCLPELRALWGTLCETIDLKLTLTPTSLRETLRRENMETQRLWLAVLKSVNEAVGAGWDRTTIRRFSNQAAMCATRTLAKAFSTGVYEKDDLKNPSAQERIAFIEQELPDDFFDLSTDNGIRDKLIVTEAFAGNHDILITNNIASIDVIGLTGWLSNTNLECEISTRILDPWRAVEAIESQHQMPDHWLAQVAVRAVVNDPYDSRGAADALYSLVNTLSQRGVDEIKNRIHLSLDNERVFENALNHLRRIGPSLSARSERQGKQVVYKEVSRQSGLALSEISGHVDSVFGSIEREDVDHWADQGGGEDSHLSR